TGGSDIFNINTKEKRVEVTEEGSILTVANKRIRLKGGNYSYSDFPYNTTIIVYNTKNENNEFYGVDSLHDKINDVVVIGFMRLNEGLYKLNGFYRIDGKVAGNESGGKGDRPKFIIAQSVNEDYEPINDFYKSNSNINDVYDVYDGLVSDYPDYISRTKLGDEYTGLPIYRYDFKPPMPHSPREIKGYRHPKVFISNVHGH